MALFEVRPDERRATTLAFLALLGITAAHTMIETSRDALFLAKVPVTHLPALYLAIAACGLATTRASAALEARRKGNAPKLDPVATSLVVAAIITTAFWFGAASPSRPLLYGLYVYSGLFASWVAGQLWLRIGAIFDVGQAKRLFGLIGTGAVLGAVVGAAVARASLAAIEVRHLLVIGAALLVVTAIGPVSMLPRSGAAPVRERARPTKEAMAAGLGAQIRAAMRDPYVVRVLGIVLLTTSVGTAIDFVFKSQIAANVPKAEMGAFLATVSLATNLASLVAQGLGVALVMRALGVHRALYVTPLLLAVGAIGLVLGGPNVLFVFYAAIAIRGIDGTLRYSLQKTCAELLFVPLPDDVRKRAKPIVDLIGQRGGQAIASIAILALATFLGPRAIAVAILVLLGAWLLVARSVRPRYLEVFRATLRRGRMDFSAQLPELDMVALEALISALSSRKDAEVLGALDFLHAQSRGRLVPSLILYHPSKTIVLRALELLVLEGRSDFVPVADRLLQHADPEVRSAALRARAAIEPDADFLRGLLADPEAEIRATALVALVAGEVLSGDEAKTTLEEHAKASLPVKRALAKALGEIASVPSGAARKILEQTIAALGTDPDTETRALAATAMGRFGTRFVPELLTMLEHRGVRASAGLAISELGDVALDTLDRALDDPKIKPEAKWRIVSALGRSAAPSALARLEKRLLTKDIGVRTRILRALRSAQRAGVVLTIDRKRLADLAEQTVSAAGRTLAFRLAHAKLLTPETRTPGSEIIQKLLADKEIEALDRLFSILALMSPEESFARIQRGLASKNPKARASSRELLENLVRPPLRERVLAIVDDIDDDARLAAIGSPRAETTYSALLSSMIDQGGELGALAVFHANEIGLDDTLRDAVARSGVRAPEGVFGEELSKRSLSERPPSSQITAGAPA